jgi:hypothetical protein
MLCVNLRVNAYGSTQRKRSCFPYNGSMDAISALQKEIAKVLDGYRRGFRNRPQTAELLEKLYVLQTPGDQKELCERLGYILRTEPIETKIIHGMGVNLPALALVALARFGPTAFLPAFVFSRLSWDDPKSMELWVREIYPDFKYSLQVHADRFESRTLAQIAEYRGSVRVSDKAFTLALIEALDNLARIVEQIEFERYERSLKQDAAKAVAGMADLQSLVAALGLEPKIVGAIGEAEKYLQAAGPFDAKKAGDLVRAAIEEAHRATVARVAEIEKLAFLGKDKDGERRNYLAAANFLTEPEEKLISLIYSMISAEASHKLTAGKDTVLFLHTTVSNYLLLIFRRLRDKTGN